MKYTNSTHSKRNLARLSGFFYLLIILGGLYGGMVVRGNMVDPESAELTLYNIMEYGQLFRIGFLADLLMVISDVMVSILFYILLKDVNRTIALLAMGFRMIQSAILGLNLLNLFSPILMIQQYAGGDNAQLAQEVMLKLQMFEYGYLISGVFFAINCALMGYLLFRSEMFPKVLGIMIGLASVGYMFNCMANFVMPEMVEVSQAVMFFTAVISELAFCLYLLVRGTRSVSH